MRNKQNTRIDIMPYVLPFAVPYRWSRGVQRQRSGLIVRMEIEGTVGWGEVALRPHVDFEGTAHAELARALVFGLDPTRGDFLEQIDLREASVRLRCGISTAWLSAKAAQEGKTLSRYLGGEDRTVAKEVPVNYLITDKNPEACAKRARQAQKDGYGTVKVKCTSDRKLDLDRIAEIRNACPDIVIRIDPNESWDPSWALLHLEAMAQFNIEYVEEPLPQGTPLTVYRDLRASSPIPIALDDSVRSATHAELIILREAADIFILKPQRIGGPDRVLKIIDLASSAGIRSVVTASIETAIGLHLGLHCAALIPSPITPCGLGTAGFFARDIAKPPETIVGQMAVPTVPGLGVDPTEWWESCDPVENHSST